jgi:predicted MPP superfamily phosphohydrolase
VYLLNEMLLMTPVILYVGLRLGALLRSRGARLAFGLFYILLLPAFPLAERLAHGAAGRWSSLGITLGYDALPYLMYLVLTVVAADVLTALLRLTGLVKAETLRAPKVRRIRFGALLLFPALVVFAGILNFARLSVSRYTVEVPRRVAPAAEAGPSAAASPARLRLVFASDFHLGGATSPRFLPRFVEAVNALEPDLVLLGGDMLEGDREGEGTGEFAAQFRRLKARHGVFGVPGNHEGFRGGSRAEFFAQAGITLLRDEVRRIEGLVTLVGRNDQGRSRQGPAARKTTAELLAGVPRDLPIVLLDHRPTDLQASADAGVDIHFSGHSHDGQLFPVNFITAGRYELSWGYKKKGPTHVFVSCGVQLWGPRVRTTGVSEIMLVDVDVR